MLIRTKHIITKTLLSLWALSMFFISYIVIYNTIDRYNLENFRDEFSRLAHLSAKATIKNDIIFLKNKISSSEEINSSLQYQRTKNILINIKEAYSDRIDDIYIFIQSEENTAMILSTYEENYFKYEFDMSDFEEMKFALSHETNLVESKFYYEKDLNKYSISAYYPIFDNGVYIAHVGIDFFLENYNKQYFLYRLLPIFPSLSISLLLFFIPLIALNLVKIRFYI